LGREEWSGKEKGEKEWGVNLERRDYQRKEDRKWKNTPTLPAVTNVGYG